jgi:hypothetical protein
MAITASIAAAIRIPGQTLHPPRILQAVYLTHARKAQKSQSSLVESLHRRDILMLGYHRRPRIFPLLPCICIPIGPLADWRPLADWPDPRVLLVLTMLLNVG